MADEEHGQDRLEFAPTHSIIYEREQVTVAISRWRLHILCDDLIKGQKHRTIDQAWPWLGTFIAFLLGLIQRDGFKDFLGLQSSTWEAIFVGGMLVSAFMFLRSAVLAVKDWGHKPVTAKDVVDELMEELGRGENA